MGRQGVIESEKGERERKLKHRKEQGERTGEEKFLMALGRAIMLACT